MAQIFNLPFMPLQHMNVIDLIALDPTTDEVVLGMTEPRPWEESKRRLFELQEKLNTYLSFALDGEMAEHYPDFTQKRLRVQLSCAEEPLPVIRQFIDMIAEQIGFQGIRFETKVVPQLAEMAQAQDGCCSSGECGCATPQEGVAQECCSDNGGCGCQ